MWSKLILVVLLLVSVSCTRVFVQPAAPSTTTTDTNTNKTDTISFRVLGNANGAKVRYSNSLDGLNQITTTLPFQETVQFKTDGAFVSLEATATSFNATVTNPFMSVQIFVNGTLFREASTTSFFLETISVSGSYRR